MNNLFAKTSLSIAIALTIVSCGGSGGGIAGIGGSGYISSGPITGFGSVFVNGVEFETDSATFDIEGISGTQDDLAIGMIVRVDGTINADGISGTATSISFDDELQGPVTELADIGNDGILRSLVILGTTIIIDSSSTSFDVSDDEANTVFDFNTIRDGNNVEVSGFIDSNGDIHATRVELKNLDFDLNSTVEIKGTINALNGTTFNLGNLSVDASSAELDDLPNGLENNQRVEVKGTLNAAYTVLTATKVEGKDDTVEDSDEFEIEGLITNYNVTAKTFMINGINVDASSTSLKLEPATLELRDDLRVEVEGSIADNTLTAKEIKQEGGDIKVHAMITTVDPAANTFKVRPVTGQPEITVTVTTDTKLESDVSETEPYTLSDLSMDLGFVEIQGYDDGNGGITATEVEAKETDEVLVQGFATEASGDAATGGDITILGLTFGFDIATKFEDENENEISGADLTALITSITPQTPRLVKIKDKLLADEDNPAGVADEVDLE